MKKICIINQKGGVAKTTTTINIGAGLSRMGQRVLIIDLDAQASIEQCLPLIPNKGLFDLLIENAELQECITHMGKNLDVIPSDERLIQAELMLSKDAAKEQLLAKKLEKLEKVQKYDYVLLDCPPAYNIISQNAMFFADQAFIPATTDVLGLAAIKKTIQNIENFNYIYDHDLKVAKIIPTMHDRRNKINREILAELQNEYYELVTDPISINSKLKESPKVKKSIFSYAKNSRGAKDYKALVENIFYSNQGQEKIEDSEEHSAGTGEGLETEPSENSTDPSKDKVVTVGIE
jgi:chromosome partitioning protein